MNDRRLSDAQIAAALRARLPAQAQAGLPGRVMHAVEITSQQRPLPSFLGALSDADPVAARRSLLIAAALLLGLALASAVAVGAWRLLQRDPVPKLDLGPTPASNGWIAYSTDGQNPGSTDITTGSDIYLVREGGEPRVIAGREGGTTRNVCPAFSPDGTRLAFGVASDQGRAVVVLGLDANGVINDTVHIAVPGSGPAVCVRWSSDGTRVGYLDGGIVVVRGLDGSTPAIAAGDPGVNDLERGRDPSDPLVSPSGDWVVRLGDCQIVVAKPDGKAAHLIALRTCQDAASPYAIAAWSPDGRQVLLLEDAGEATTLRAIGVDSTLDVTIVSAVRTNGARSSPGRGDVSWQPVFP